MNNVEGERSIAYQWIRIDDDLDKFNNKNNENIKKSFKENNKEMHITCDNI